MPAPPASQDVDANRVYYEGWLAKRSGGSKNGELSLGELRKNWDDRWFVLTHDKISYYKSQKAYLQREEPKAVIPIQDLQFQLDEQVARRFKLRVHALGRVLALEAPSTLEVEEWQHAVEQRLADVQQRKAAEVAKVQTILAENGKKTLKAMSPEQRQQYLREAISDSAVLHEGWLKKESGGKGGGGGGGGGMKKISAGNLKHHEDLRYCLLSPLYLRYFETREDFEMDHRPKGVINLAGASLESRHKPGKEFKPKFKLVLPAHNGAIRVMPLIANDKEDMELWVSMFTAAIQRADGRAEMKATGDYGDNVIAANLAAITHEGMMLKKSKKHTNQKRWFRVQDGVLYYFSEQDSTEPINWIQPDAETKLTCDPTDDNKFKMETGSGRKYTLSTIMEDDGRSREEWVQCLYAIVKVHCEALGIEQRKKDSPLETLKEAKKHRDAREADLAAGGDGVIAATPLWRDRNAWKPYCTYMVVPKLILALGGLLTLLALYSLQFNAALVFMAMSGCGFFMYNRKHRRPKKKWMKKRGMTDGNGKSAGKGGAAGKMKGFGAKVPGMGAMGGGGGGMSASTKAKVAMAKGTSGGMRMETAATLAKAFK
eukprot:SAG22_NODE_866_length_6778_cov_2.436592_1_plen_600_part_00